MKKSVKLISCLLCAAMLVTLSSCNSEKKKDDTTTTTAKKTVTTSSDRTKVESDYEIKKVDDLVVAVGTSEQDVIAKLPTELEVLMKGSSSAASEKLFTETFDSADTFAQSWTVVGNANNDVMAIENGSMAVKKACNYFRAYLNDLEWMNNESEEFANYAIKTVIKGTAESPSNNFGIIFRASDISETGPDGYYGMYVGIGDSDGKLCVGYAMNNWNLVEYVDFDYVPNQDYTLEVLVNNDKFVVLLDGENVYEGECKFDYGTVGLRTYEQLFEASEFEVRTLGASDYEQFEGGYEYYEKHPVTWSCTDYDPNAKGKYGFIGKVTDLENAAILVKVQVKENVPADPEE